MDSLFDDFELVNCEHCWESFEILDMKECFWCCALFCEDCWKGHGEFMYDRYVNDGVDDFEPETEWLCDSCMQIDKEAMKTLYRSFS